MRFIPSLKSEKSNACFDQFNTAYLTLWPLRIDYEILCLLPDSLRTFAFRMLAFRTQLPQCETLKYTEKQLCRHSDWQIKVRSAFVSSQPIYQTYKWNIVQIILVPKYSHHPQLIKSSKPRSKIHASGSLALPEFLSHRIYEFNKLLVYPTMEFCFTSVGLKVPAWSQASTTTHAVQ